MFYSAGRRPIGPEVTSLIYFIARPVLKWMVVNSILSSNAQSYEWNEFTSHITAGGAEWPDAHADMDYPATTRYWDRDEQSEKCIEYVGKLYWKFDKDLPQI